MNILVTGGAGYVGSVVTRTLLGKGHQVRVLDSLLYGGQALLGICGEDGFDFMQGDVRSPDAVGKALDGVNAVVHLAAIVGDPACARQPDLAREVNLDASLRLLELSRRRGIGRFLFASTCSNYGKMPNSSQYVTEESDLSPLSLYSETKVAVEETLLDLSAQDELAVTVLRFATVFGLSPRMRFDLTVNEFTMKLLTERRLTVYGEQFWRPYIHVRDAARAIAMVLDTPSEKVHGRVYNVGDTRENYQKGQLVELIRSQIGCEVVIEQVEKQEDPRDYRVSFQKIQEDLGFHITRTVDDGIREVIDCINQGIITDLDNLRYRN